MSPEPLTAERILEATEEVLRRHGPGKATVVDVARALGVSHGSVYRHFGTKAALREAVTKRWLDRTADELRHIAGRREQSADGVLRAWLAALFAAKRQKAGGDPELFATYEVLLDGSSGVVAAHLADLVGQLTVIVEAGVARGEFTAVPGGAAATAEALFHATSRFHDPAHAPEWSRPGIGDAFEATVELLVRGLTATAGREPGRSRGH
ncbi:TetR family transcriptional regulator [Streptomyces sulfonofaciens]|uniref:TetR family transcriptional regulator n=1 Tax=Streptomyces sulfonofaciens TaxID=68272 RepID=A0A919GLS6_9ACTN|nr:TetR family transcriptional regulator [Streptomyces sulfonofaciens]GHH87004.1 TetR family transcriptional regulator [Streptomyces sulfonofaciens]